MPTSNSYNYKHNRDSIITRSLRLIGAIAQGDTPTTSAISEAAIALNDLVKAWQSDGMPLWKVSTSSAITLVASQYQYTIGLNDGTDLSQLAPIRVLQAWLRNTSTNADTPLVLITKQQYFLLSAKTSTGRPSQIYYNPPGAAPNTENQGTLYMYTAPDSTAVSTYQMYFNATYPFADFDTSADVPDFPQYWYNAVVWGLADQLAYEYGLGVTDRAQISKKAAIHKDEALSYGTEEGSMYLQPEWIYRV